MIKQFTFYVLCVLLLWSIPFTLRAQQPDTLDFGYRRISAADFNGAVYTVTAKQLESLPVTNLTNLLSGIVPGYFSIQTSGGTVNESASYWLRGVRTNNEGVLVLVDGQERAFGVLTSREVESITVVKDVSITALYGTRAANGIIFVKTKKGEKGRPSIDFTAELINQDPIGMLEAVNGLTYATHYNEAMKYDGRDASSLYSDLYLNNYRNREGVNAEHYPDVDWMGDYFQNSSWVQRYNLGISGGSDRTRYFINGGLLTQKGMFNTDEEATYSTNNSTKLFNLRSNIEVDVTSSTTLNLDLYGWNDEQNRPGGSTIDIFDALTTTPANAFPAYYTDPGDFYTDQAGTVIKSTNGKIVAGNNLSANPWARLNRNGYSILNRTYGSFRTKLDQELSFITPGLSASASLSMDSYTAAVTDRSKAYAYYSLSDLNSTVLRRTNNDGQMSNDISDRSSQTRTSLDFQLAYNRAYGAHAVSATTFYNQYEFDNQTSIPSRFQTIGYWLGYNYDHRYYLDFTGSYHGVYKFAPGKRFGFFPAVSAGWSVSNERFFEPLKDAVSYFKLRGSYGLVGNSQGVSEFQYRSRMSSINGVYTFGNNQNSAGGFIEDIIANPNLTWEKSKQLNVGANVRMLDDRLSYVVDYFHDKRYDMYMANSNVTSLLGLIATVDQNIGEMYSQGIEMALSWQSTIGKVRYRVGGMYSQTDNMIEKTGEVIEPYEYMQSAGFGRGIRRGYVDLGLFDSYDDIATSPRQTFSEVEPGDIKYKDINGDGIIDRNDQIPLGYGNVPRVFYGINGGLSYNNFGLNFLFQGAAKVTQMLSNKVAYPFISNGTIYKHQLDYWTPENRSASLPNISTITSGVNNTQTSSFWMRDASFIRLKTVELSYELPASITRNLFLDNLRIYATGYNLLTWTTGESPLDPEDNGNANTMPLTRNISLGLTARF